MKLNEKQSMVACVVVTYNRKALLRECLEAIFAQTYPITQLILIDNASTDGTKKMLEDKGYLRNEKFKYCLMDSNLGGAGGFYEGLKTAKDEFDWVWIMDDDTIPDVYCLEKLLQVSNSVDENVSFLASSVYGPNKEPMNIPSIDFNLTENGYPDWYFNLDKGLVKIKSATFVSLLISGDALEKCGLPCKDYFIWGDDTEYTTRLTKYYGPAYMVGNSVVCHKRYNAKALSIVNETEPKRIENYFYYYRNLLVNTYVYEGNKAGRKFYLRCLWFAIKIIRKPHGFTMMKTVIKGICQGRKQRKNFIVYVNSQLRQEEKR